MKNEPEFIEKRKTQKKEYYLRKKLEKEKNV